jgi:hypothetical protein
LTGEWNLDTFYKPKEDCLSVPPHVVWKKKHTVGKIILHFDRGMESRYVLQAKRRLSVRPHVVWKKKHTVGKTILHSDRGEGSFGQSRELYIYLEREFQSFGQWEK